MNKFKGKTDRIQTARPSNSKYDNQIPSKNPYQNKISLVESMMVVHPLLDRLI